MQRRKAIGYRENKIWKRLEEICVNSSEPGNIIEMCDSAVELVKTIRDTFPDYTLHDETHICNVINWMEQILGDSGIEMLSAGECAMLILAACYHDIGMCYTKEQREKELKSHRFIEYLEKNPKEYLMVKRCKETGEEIPKGIQIEYFRRIHPQRVDELLPENWKINTTGNPSAETEWKKHQASNGFKLMQENRTLVYRAVCGDMQDEYTIMNFLDYVDEELENCSLKLKQYGHAKWKSINIPMKGTKG